jgi:myo-inositol 2-dehydrogenase/D-chiro-inositol 1-dehydrogenase
MDHFARILSSEAVPETGYAASLASLELAEAAAESAKTGLPVRL